MSTLGTGAAFLKSFRCRSIELPILGCYTDLSLCQAISASELQMSYSSWIFPDSSHFPLPCSTITLCSLTKSRGYHMYPMDDFCLVFWRLIRSIYSFHLHIFLNGTISNDNGSTLVEVCHTCATFIGGSGNSTHFSLFTESPSLTSRSCFSSVD